VPTPARALFSDVNPDNSDLDPSDPDGSSGGRVNGVATVRSDNQTYYAASEWGGLYKSRDRGLTWSHLDRHVPQATWDVAVSPAGSNLVYATSFYDGRSRSRAGINVSRDAGGTWTHPTSANPPASFNCNAARRTEPSAFGIAIRSDAAANVFIGTNCGLARSTNSGQTWTFIDPSPNTPANDVWDVVAQPGGVVDICGDDGHFRSTNNGNTWTVGGLPFGGQCSLAVSPDEPYVLLATVGTSIFESDNAGTSWTALTNPTPQGRIPFVVTNQRSTVGGQDRFDLWFGDVSLFRTGCVTPAVKRPGGSPRCPANRWVGGFTRTAGAHDDAGDLAFDSRGIADACPVLFSSDGGVYYNTDTSSDCQEPNWEQPRMTPHATWLFTMSGANQAGAPAEDLYFGLQDNGSWATRNAGTARPNWHNADCCDVFDTATDGNRVVYTVCCFGGRSNRLFVAAPGMVAANEVNTYPPGFLAGFRFIDILDTFGDRRYVLVTTSGVFVTLDITASPVVWTQLGTGPANACGVKAAVRAGTPTFYVQAGNCGGGDPDQLWRYTGTGTGGTWQRITPPGGGGFGIFDVDATNPARLYASNLTTSGPRMVSSVNGGTAWTRDLKLDNLMTGGGAFKYQNQRGPTDFTSFGGYPQPSLVAFDPEDSKLIVAGGRDSGVFASRNGGQSWMLLTNPVSPGPRGTPPHLPRPWFAYFDHEPAGTVNIYVGTQGRGVWRITLP